MKRNLLFICIAILMAMALIVSCDSKTPEPTPVEPKKNVISIGSENYDSLSDAVKAAKDGDTIEVAEGAYTIDSPIAIDKKITIKGTGIGKTVFNIVESEASDTKVIDINAEGVVFEGIDIRAAFGEKKLAYWAINVNKNNFTFKNSAIKGDFSNVGSGVDPIMMGITIAAGSTGTTIEGSVFRDCYTPIYAASSSFTLKDSKWNSGVEIKTLPTEATVISGNATLEVEEYQGKIKFQAKESDVKSYLKGNPTIAFFVADVEVKTE